MYPTILAIDFGTQRIGLAISRATLAEPLTIISNDDQKFEVIKKIIYEERVNQVVVGVSENVMAVLTHTFIGELQKEIPLPIHITDETLSSKTVHAKLKEAKKSKRSGYIDHYAAAEFLQEWLDENSSSLL